MRFMPTLLPDARRRSDEPRLRRRRASTRLKSGTPSGLAAKTKLEYDGLDRRDARVERPDSALARRYDTSYVGQSELVSREQDPGKEQAYDYDSSGERQGQATKLSGAPASTYAGYAKDVAGSVEGIEGPGGTMGPGQRYAYDPYGELENAREVAGQAKENPFRFEGFYHHEAIKTYDMQARQYRPDIGRFLTQDRFESASGDFELQSDPLTQNRYAFAGGNPVSRVEWDGHQASRSLRPCQGVRVSRLQECGQKRIPDFQGRDRGKVRIGVFIMDAQISTTYRIPKTNRRVGLEGPGDGRGFERNFAASATRATFIADFRRDSVTAVANSSCGRTVSPVQDVVNVDDLDCFKALPFKRRGDAGPNYFGVRSIGGRSRGFDLVYSLGNSYTARFSGPNITIDHTLAFRACRRCPGGLRISKFGNTYPSVEAYYQRRRFGSKRSILQCRETDSPVDLVDPFGGGNERKSRCGTRRA
jgi:RHS repeat-associated protein